MIDLYKMGASVNQLMRMFNKDTRATQSIGEVNELITRLRQAEKDAARYRWLRESTHFDSMQHKLYCLHYGERLDVAIDEAMQCQP